MTARRPKTDPPADGDTGATRGTWWIAMVVIALLVVGAVVVLVLVGSGQLSRSWAYAVLPVAIVAAAAARVLTIFKAGSEEKHGDATPRPEEE